MSVYFFEDPYLEKDPRCMTGLLQVFELQHLLEEKRSAYRTLISSGGGLLPLSRSEAHRLHHADKYRDGDHQFLNREYLDLLSHTKHYLHSTHPSSRLSSFDEQDLPMNVGAGRDKMLKTISSAKRHSGYATIHPEEGSSYARLPCLVKEREREHKNGQNIYDRTEGRCRECKNALHFLDSVDASWRSTEIVNAVLASCEKCQQNVALHGRLERSSIDFLRRFGPAKKGEERVIRGDETFLKNVDPMTDYARSAKPQSRTYSNHTDQALKIVEGLGSEGPKWSSTLAKTAKGSPQDLRNGLIHPPRFSYDGEESFRSYLDAQSTPCKSKETPRYSLDGRESTRSLTDSLRNSSYKDTPGKLLERQSTRLLLDTARQLPLQKDSSESDRDESAKGRRRSPNVVARLMGLEELPDRVLPSDQSNYSKPKLSGRSKLLQELLDLSPVRRTPQAKSSESPHSDRTSLHQLSEESWQKIKPISSTTSSFSSSGRKEETLAFCERRATPVLTPSHLMDIMPPPLKQKHCKLSPTSNYRENSQEEIDKQSRQKKGFYSDRIFLAEVEKQHQKLHARESLKGYNTNRSKELSEDLLLQRYLHSMPIQGQQNSAGRRDEHRMESMATKGLMLGSFFVQKHESGDETETGNQSGQKTGKVAQTALDLVFSSASHGPRGRTKLKNKMQGVENSVEGSVSSPGRNLLAIPAIQLSKGSARTTRMESLSDSDASVNGKSPSRKGSRNQRTDSKILAQSLAAQDMLEEAGTHKSQFTRKGHSEKTLTKPPMLGNSKVLALQSSPGHKGKMQESACNLGSHFHKKTNSAEVKMCSASKTGHVKQINRENKGKKSLWDSSHQEIPMSLCERQGSHILVKTPSPSISLEDDLSDPKIFGIENRELDGELYEGKHPRGFHQQVRNTLAGKISNNSVHSIMHESLPSEPRKFLKEKSSAQFVITTDTVQNSTDFTREVFNVETTQDLQTNWLLSTNTQALSTPVNNSQEAENSPLDANKHKSLTDNEVAHKPPSYDEMSEPVTTCLTARASKLKLETATPPESPNPTSYQLEKHNFLGESFVEPLEQPSPLSVLDASLLLDACSPEAHEDRIVQQEDFQLGGVSLKAAQLCQVQGEILECQELGEMFGKEEPHEQGSRACAVNASNHAASVCSKMFSSLSTPDQVQGDTFGKEVLLSMEEELQFVQEILTKYKNEGAFFTTKCPLSDNLIIEGMLSPVEIAKPNISASDKTRNGNALNEQPRGNNLRAMQRRLLFDCTKEVVEKSGMSRTMWIILNKKYRPELLIQEMEELIFQSSQSAVGTIEDMVNADLSSETQQYAFKNETMNLVNDVERLILKQLVDETLLALITLSRRRICNIHSKSRRTLFSS